MIEEDIWYLEVEIFILETFTLSVNPLIIEAYTIPSNLLLLNH